MGDAISLSVPSLFLVDEHAPGSRSFSNHGARPSPALWLTRGHWMGRQAMTQQSVSARPGFWDSVFVLVFGRRGAPRPRPAPQPQPQPTPQPEPTLAPEPARP